METKFIVFQLGNEEYGIAVEQVKSIEKMQHITRVPRTEKYVRGVINLRGVVIPILDLRKQFGLQEQTHTDHTRIIIVIINDIEVGLIVDAANDVLDIYDDHIEPAPEVIEGIEADYISGVVKVEERLIVLVNLGKVLGLDDQE
ncbi:chemotaxis protein CheW [Priestia flexa]|jgi:purine-binding chemotaxis protein CheW|uniref:Chemotaxis protein CheW n=2 Tax=Priestia TaxID=2800373 RepID=A0A0V8JRD7_9BACI|nr:MULTISPECIES: chemotaxis protein CheW [Bacillaceae]KSU89647.1 chemotaxis protein CheW [Priestia veravalensis]KZB93249.1 chemotaxis protein CheW [Bacillus sp. VT 712]MBN8250064.1 chemotaxis protein CheW [Priestia flexa]MBN8434613.1 chemotaxis protein CheW [Priestia flexa]MBY6084772.1 chemotaxis protein CheW [Priestia flexa]